MFFFTMIFFSGLHAQETNALYKEKKIVVSRDTIALEKESINSNFFDITDRNNQIIDTCFYTINFPKGTLLFNSNYKINTDTLTVHYLKFPEILTKEYSIYDASRVVSNEAISGSLYKTEASIPKKNIPFDGLNTSGSITRGVTIGNNQNATLNSNLDLQITGKISEKVSLRASIQDNNIPLQNGGYSQKLDQFDNIFIELFSDKWNIRAGDVFLENKKTQFLNFNKKVQGIAANFDLGDPESKTTIFASAAIVRGQYAKSDFIGREGNQGPYKLKGQNGELYVLVISDSERVYANGVLLNRGENKEYTIDYNAGEVQFTPLFPITSEMRIAIEYQFSDRNYTRFVTYAGSSHENKKWNFGGYFYSESDLKNQPLQQNLSKEQAQILANSGDNTNLMVAPSAYLDSYSENKILYRKKSNPTAEIFEYSNDPQEQLYAVHFSLVGQGKGNYIYKNTSSLTKIFEYVVPVNAIAQGNYEPIIQLIAPTKIQVATFLGKYKTAEKTAVDFEIAISNKDQNLFSTIDDNNNKGLAGKINTKQRLVSKKMALDVFANYQFIQDNFKSVERLNTIEFNRDWNLGSSTLGTQSYLTTGLDLNLFPKQEAQNMGLLNYQFEKLDFSKNYSGNKQRMTALFRTKKWTLQNQASLLNSDNTNNTSYFIRNQSQLRFHYKKNWIGSSFRLENNLEKNKATNAPTALSQKFSEYGFFVGRGDSTKVFVELGYHRRANDSLQKGILARVNSSNTYVFKSKLIQTDKSDLAVFSNYRVLKFNDTSKKKEVSLNSRIVYNDRFFGQLVQNTTVYETSSGNIPQQEFTYIEVPVGKGVYTWNDYNGNGIQELEEFEVAPFIDLAKYIRVYLPNQVYIKTHQNKFSQSVTLHPTEWQNETGLKKKLSYLYNQTSFLIDRKMKNDGDRFDLNPFNQSAKNVMGLTSSFRNSLYYNRGKQNHSITYSYLQNNAKNLLSIGSQESKNNSHQLQYSHLYQKNWLFSFFTKTISTEQVSENFPEKNYILKGFQWAPKISYLFSKNTTWDLFYEYQIKENQIGKLEKVSQNRLGTAFTYSISSKFTMNGECSFYKNKFIGDQLSSVGFQMLEGLQAGQNVTWRLLLQKNITQFLDINFNYQGRKSEPSTTIHTGSVQLRASF